MGKKGKKTRWRRLPIGGTDEEGGLSLEPAPPTTDPHRITFNEDEYTKITTPRQDVLFKKGYFGRKRTPNPNPNPSPSETQEVHSGDSVESESYASEEPQYAYPTGYMDPTGLYYVNGNTFETYDPYTGTVTVVVGPPPQYPGGAPILAALPCQPVPLQPVEWCPPPWCYSYNRRKRYSTDSQNCSAQSSESTGPPGSPQEPVDEGACAMYAPQYVYPGYMFGPPIYNMNGVTVQGVMPQPSPLPPDPAANKRRKKRRRRRRGGVTDDGSESSCCEEPLTCDVPSCQSETSSDAVCQSGASSDAGAPSANSDSGINTDPSGSNSPPLHVPTLAQVTESNIIQFECHQEHQTVHLSEIRSNQVDPVEVSESKVLLLCSDEEIVIEASSLSIPKDEDRSQDEATTPEEVSEELSTAEDDVTPILCVAAPEFSSQESTLSCISTPSVTKDVLQNESEITNVDVFQEDIFESCPSITDTDVACPEADYAYEALPCEASSSDDLPSQPISSVCPDPIPKDDDQNTLVEESNAIDQNSDVHVEEVIEKLKDIEIGELVKIPKLDEVLEPESIQTIEIIGPSEILQNESEITIYKVEEIAIEPECFVTSCGIQTSRSSEDNHTLSRCPPCKSTIAPVPPPRRKRSMCRAADKLATKIVEEAIREGTEEAARARLASPMSITEAVTRWLNSQDSSPLTCPVLDSDCETDEDDDEGIEVGGGSTDQKNVRGNPFLVPSRSGSGQRVAKDCESGSVESAGEWDLWEHSHTRDMCDPSRSVDKYYRLGAEEGAGDKVPPSVYKTAMHIHHQGPFPCGVCCIIQ